MLYIMDACTVAPLFRGADGPNCKDIMNGIASSMPSCLCQDTAVFLVRNGLDMGQTQLSNKILFLILEISFLVNSSVSFSILGMDAKFLWYN